MAEVIHMGKRTLEFNPIVELIKETHPDDLILLDAMFTWEISDAIAEKERLEAETDKTVVIDGVGWRNAGNEGYINLELLDGREYVKDGISYQVTKITQGCPNKCWFCFSGDFEVLGIPQIKRNKVLLTDENLLAHPDIEMVLTELSQIKNNGKVVYYEAICGFEKARINDGVAVLLKRARFKNVRIAWDDPLTWRSQTTVCNTVKTLVKAGFNSEEISIFVLTNANVSMKDCFGKLDLMKIWGVKINDCCYNCNYTDPIPSGWTLKEIKKFRKKARQHNQIVRFKIFPELDRKKRDVPNGPTEAASRQGVGPAQPPDGLGSVKGMHCQSDKHPKDCSRRSHRTDRAVRDNQLDRVTLNGGN